MGTNKPRVVVADAEVCRDLGVPYIVILSDFGYWIDQADELTDWCKDNHADVQGVTVNIYNEQSLTAFLLKWS